MRSPCQSRPDQNACTAEFLLMIVLLILILGWGDASMKDQEHEQDHEQD
jgi:hypothetical protein